MQTWEAWSKSICNSSLSHRETQHVLCSHYFTFKFLDKGLEVKMPQLSPFSTADCVFFPRKVYLSIPTALSKESLMTVFETIYLGVYLWKYLFPQAEFSILATQFLMEEHRTQWEQISL